MTRIAIIGSCVTRDAFRPQDSDEWEITAYYARSSLASAMSEIPFVGVDLDGIDSAFQRRIVQADLAKELPGFLAVEDSDLILYDPVDERFDLLRDPVSGAVCTYSAELTRAASIPETERIGSGSPEFMELWEAGWTRFVEALDRRGRRSALRVNAARWAVAVDDGSDLPDAYPPGLVASSNAFLDRLYTRMRADLAPEQFIEPGQDELVACRNHKWGLSPFHYVPAFYASLRAGLRSSLGQATPRRWVFKGDGDRHVVDVVDSRRDGDVLDVALRLTGWARLTYVAVGVVAGGVYYRLILTAVEQDQDLRLHVPRDLLVDSAGGGAAEGDVTAVRLYVYGVPGSSGAKLDVARAELADPTTVSQDEGVLRVHGWHRRYQLPIAESTTVEEFSPAPGLVALYPVDVAGMRLWTLAGRRRGRRLAVGFHGAADRSTTEYPYFERVTSRKEAPWSFLLLCDATLVQDAEMGLGWFLGSAETDLIDVVERLTARMAGLAGASEVAVTGGSGGGFAALQLSARMPRSIALVFAPQTVLWRYHQEDWARASAAVFGHGDPTADLRIQERASVIPRYLRGTTNLVDYVINQGDTHHVVEHCAPFAGLFGLDPRGGRSRDGRVQILPIDLGDGHLPIPRDVFESHLLRAFERLQEEGR
ncbi:DUF6270 domain-containing protein [Cellulomonas iranensis]|uniref:DUF6270 domain-containing protein n=1 Tax=Cellulomonas iranensis TaxID=76862 RepID=UPI0013D818C4|nr:DUF6270 domain-containing protein [Cellulomonas iranensis]